MGMDSCRLTVYFEAPFWVGVFERTRSGALFAARVVFGAEPKDYEVYARVLKEYARLRFSPAVESAAHAEIRNPKRARRAAAKLTGSAGTGTRAQQALQMQYEQQKRERGAGVSTKSMQALAAQREQLKTERKQQSRAQQEAAQQRRFEQKQHKKQQKHRGH